MEAAQSRDSKYKDITRYGGWVQYLESESEEVKK